MTSTRAPAKKPTLSEILAILGKQFGTPVFSDRVDDPLVDHLLVGVLGCHVESEQAREGIRALSEAFLDLNEARSSPLAELEEVMAAHIPAEKRRAACGAIRMALQDVWDGTHGLDLESLRGRDPEDQRAFLLDLPNTPGGPAALVFQIALGEEILAFGPREQHLLARFGLLPRSNSPQRLRQAMERKIPASERYLFAWLAGAGSHLCEEDWDPKHPLAKLLIAINAKEVTERERAEKREEQRRKQEERLRQQEEARRLREEEKARKALERAEKKKAAEEARKAARLEAIRLKAEAKKKAEALKKEAARKKAEALKKKAAALKKKAAALKKKAAATKKKAAVAKKKAAAQKKAAAAKKKAAALKKKAAAKKKAPARKKVAPARRKKAPATRKPAAKKKKKPAAKKKKPAAKKKKTAAKKKPAAKKKKPAARKKKKTAAKKKPAAKKKKPAAKKKKAAARGRPARKK